MMLALDLAGVHGLYSKVRKTAAGVVAMDGDEPIAVLKRTNDMMTASQRGRRVFLKQAAVVAACASTASVATAIGQPVTQAVGGVVPTPCVNGKTPMYAVEGKVAFITGASSGIGLGMARAFASAGMKIAIGYRTKEHLDEAMKALSPMGNRVHAIRVDVTDRPSLEKAADETVRTFGKVHVLVNNAGINGFAPLSDTTYDDWDWTINVNLTGAFNGVRAFLPHIRRSGEGGHIITTSSIWGLFVVSGLQGAYAASKFAVVGMMEALRAELIGTNIGSSVFCPGPVKSNIIDSSRNRPERLGNTHFNKYSEVIAGAAKALNNPDVAMDPLRAGQLVLRGMQNNDLYILTHPEFDPFLRDRNAALIASTSAGVQGSGAPSWYQGSIYSNDRDHRDCREGASAVRP